MDELIFIQGSYITMTKNTFWTNMKERNENISADAWMMKITPIYSFYFFSLTGKNGGRRPLCRSRRWSEIAETTRDYFWRENRQAQWRQNACP